MNPVPKRGLSYLSGGGGTFRAKSRTKPFLLLSFVSPLLPPLPGWTENANRIDRKEEREERKFDKSFSSPSFKSAGGKSEVLNFLMRSHLSQILKGKGNTFLMNGCSVLVGFFLYLPRKKLHVFLDFLFQSPSSNTRCLHMQPIPPSPSPPNPNVCILLTEGGGRVDGRGQCLWGEICTERGGGRRGWRRLRKNPICVLTHIAQKPKKAALFWAALFLSAK